MYPELNKGRQWEGKFTYVFAHIPKVQFPQKWLLCQLIWYLLKDDALQIPKTQGWYDFKLKY